MVYYSYFKKAQLTGIKKRLGIERNNSYGISKEESESRSELSLAKREEKKGELKIQKNLPV